MDSLRKKLIYLKVYMNRSVGYLTLANSGMILFLLLSKLKENGTIGLEVDKFFIQILLLGILLLIFLGWLEINKFKGIQTESLINKSLSPPWLEVNEKLDKNERQNNKRKD